MCIYIYINVDIVTTCECSSLLLEVCIVAQFIVRVTDSDQYTYQLHNQGRKASLLESV